MTKRERRGRLWLAILTATLALIPLFRLSITLLSFHQGLNVWQGMALPAANLCLLAMLWTGEPWMRWGAIVFYLLDGGITLGPWLVASAAAWELTSAEQAAAGRQVFLQVMLPAMAPFIALSVWKLTFAGLLAFSPSLRAFQYHQHYHGGTLWSALRRWSEGDRPPTTSEHEIGHVSLRSGALLLADPMYIASPQRIAGLPLGSFPVIARIISYPEGGKRIALVSFKFRAGPVTRKEVLGNVGVDSASIIAIDEQTYRDHWQEVGPERIGLTSSPDHNREVAARIERRFGLRWRPLNGFQSMFLEPISEELEQEITEYLETFPEYANFTVLYFRVETNNTFDRIQEAMSDVSWTELILHEDDDTMESLIAFTSGFGDGCYDLVGLYNQDQLLAIEMTFIGPEQDAILEGFPVLRDPAL